MENKKQYSDTYFNKEVIATFYNAYPPPGELEQEVFDAHADSYFCLNSYDKVWLYREFKECLVKHGQERILIPENYVALVNIYIKRSGSRELQAQKVELLNYFQQFLGMNDQELADYSITMLNGVQVF